MRRCPKVRICRDEDGRPVYFCTHKGWGGRRARYLPACVYAKADGISPETAPFTDGQRFGFCTYYREYLRRLRAGLDTSGIPER